MKNRIVILMFSVVLTFAGVSAYGAGVSGQEEEKKEASIEAAASEGAAAAANVVPEKSLEGSSVPTAPAVKKTEAGELKPWAVRRFTKHHVQRVAQKAEQEREEKEEGEVKEEEVQAIAGRSKPWAIRRFIGGHLQKIAQKAEEARRKEEGEVKEGAAMVSEGAQAVVGEESNTRTLLIFFDDSEIVREDKNSAITQSAVTALYQEAGPILISGSLLAHIFNIKGNHDAETKRILAAFYKKFDATRWAIYKDEESYMFLLVPLHNMSVETALKDFNVKDLETIATTDKDSLITYFNTEKKIKGERKTEYDKAEQLAGKKGDTKFLKRKFRYFLEFFESLFSHIDYSVQGAPQWVIYLEGHGESGKSIAHLSIEKERTDSESEFQQFVNFFNKKIKMKIFIYASCYAAGVSAREVYGELMASTDVRTYPFAIVTAATTDAPTYGGIIDVDLEGNIKFGVAFDIFVREIKKELVDYTTVFGYLFPLVEGEAEEIANIPQILPSFVDVSGIPQIRPPYVAAWFPVIDFNNGVIRIGRVVAATRDKPLIIKQYKAVDNRMQDPQAILLATDKISFPIIFDASIKEKPPFISLLSGEAMHSIKLVEYRGVLFDDFDVINIVGDIEYADTKTFIIDELRLINDQGQSKLFYNVKINIKEGELDIVGESEGKRGRILFDKKMYDFFKGAGKGDLDIVSAVLAEGIDVNMRDRYGRTVLHEACDAGREKLAQLLINKNADVTIQDKDGKTALHLVSEANNEGIVALLLEHGADKIVNMQDRKGFTPLLYAVRHINEEGRKVAQLLLEHGARPDIANKEGKSPLDIKWMMIRFIEQEIANEMLRQAVVEGNLEKAKNALDKDADIRMRLSLKGNRIIGAEPVPKEKVFRGVEREGAEPAIKRKIKIRRRQAIKKISLSLLDVAIQYGHVEIVKMLLDKGLSVDKASYAGKTPLFFAVEARVKNPDAAYAIITELLSRGADVNAQDDSGLTPLMYAILSSDEEVVRQLILSGADTLIKDKSGKTAFEMAQTASMTRVLRNAVYERVTIKERQKTGESWLGKAKELGRKVGAIIEGR